MGKKSVFSSRLLFYLSLAVTFICGFILMVLVDPTVVKESGKGILDLQFAHSPSESLMVLQTWGAAGKAFQLHWMWLDYIYPAAYGLFIFLALQRSLNYALPKFKWIYVVAYLPLFAALMDWAENTAEICMMLNLQAVPRLFALHRVFVYAKWGAVAASIILLIALLVAGLFRRKTAHSAA